MQRIAFLLLFTLVVSCDYFDAKKINSEAILEEELKTFNWNTIDIYPAFGTCKTEATKEVLKQCFENTLSNHISEALEEETIIVNHDINDTIILEFLISEIGDIKLNKIVASETIKKAIPNLEGILINSLSNLPKLLPAIKRNQPVKTAFTLPIKINAN